MIDISGPEFIVGIILFVLVKIVSVIAAIAILLYLLTSKSGQPRKRVVACCAATGVLLLNLQGWYAGRKYDDWVHSGTPPYSYGAISDKGIYTPKQESYMTINFCSNYQLNYTRGCAMKLKTLLFFGMFDFI